MTIPKHVKILLDSNPLRCACGNERREGFVFVEFGQVVIGCCKECQVSWEYDRGSVRGEWRKGEPLAPVEALG